MKLEVRIRAWTSNTESLKLEVRSWMSKLEIRKVRCLQMKVTSQSGFSSRMSLLNFLTLMSLLRDSPATKRTSDSWSSQLLNRESAAMAKILGNSARLLLDQKKQDRMLSHKLPNRYS